MLHMTAGLLQSKKDGKNHKTTPQSAIADSSPYAGEPKQRATPVGATVESPAPRLFLYLYSFTKFSRSAFMTTQKLDRLIAAAPNIGSSIQPVIGIHTPAASGMPITL